VARRLNEKIGFRLEGRIKEHTWYRDRYWDHLFFSLRRDDWAAVVRRYSFVSGVEEELTSQIVRGDELVRPSAFAPSHSASIER
jgi:hypothetical protein